MMRKLLHGIFYWSPAETIAGAVMLSVIMVPPTQHWPFWGTLLLAVILGIVTWLYAESYPRLRYWRKP